VTAASRASVRSSSCTIVSFRLKHNNSHVTSYTKVSPKPEQFQISSLLTPNSVNVVFGSYTETFFNLFNVDHLADATNAYSWLSSSYTGYPRSTQWRPSRLVCCQLHFAI